MLFLDYDYLVRGRFSFEESVKVGHIDKLTGLRVFHEECSFLPLVRYVAALLKVYSPEDIEILTVNKEKGMTFPWNHPKWDGFSETPLIYRLAEEYNRGLWPELDLSTYERTPKVKSE